MHLGFETLPLWDVTCWQPPIFSSPTILFWINVNLTGFSHLHYVWIIIVIIITYNEANFQCSSVLWRFIVSKNGSWVDFLKQAVDNVGLSFLYRKAMTKVSIPGSKYSYHFLQTSVYNRIIVLETWIINERDENIINSQ